MKIKNGKIKYNYICVKKIDYYFFIEVDGIILLSVIGNAIKLQNNTVAEKIVKEIEEYKDNINLVKMKYLKNAVSIVDNIAILQSDFAYEKCINKLKFDSILYLPEIKVDDFVSNKIKKYHDEYILPKIFEFNNIHKLEMTVNYSFTNNMKNEKEVSGIKQYLTSLSAESIYFRLVLCDVLDSMILADLLCLQKITVKESIKASFLESICQMEVYGEDFHNMKQIGAAEEELNLLIEFL
jgi:chaperone required for assembly of F1-ATPase